MNHVVLLLVGLSAQLCCCISLLDTKGAYNIVLKHLEVVKMNSSPIDFNISIGKIDRYNFAISAFIVLKEDMPLSTQVTVQAYEFLSNEYRPFAIHYEKSLCDLMVTDYKYMFYPDLLKTGGKIPQPRCPMRKGNYWYKNYQPHSENFPISIPLKKTMLEFKILNVGVTFVRGRVYLELDRDAVIREKFTGVAPDRLKIFETFI